MKPAIGSVTRERGPIESLDWPAMTTSFGVKDKALLGKLSKDEKIDFKLVKSGSGHVGPAGQVTKGPFVPRAFSGLVIALFAFFMAAGTVEAQGVTLMHVHGLAYSGDGKRLMIPSHHGLAVYQNGKWSKAPGPQHDYMGFSATAKHLYSSGHPEARSGLVNPFGLIRSRDDGRTWDKLGLEGETDFHVLGTSWETNAIYVWNPAPNSRMKASGLHYTLNDGLAWIRAAAEGLGGEPRAVAVHPKDAATVAVATSQGLFMSRDSGQRFTKLDSAGEGLSVFFDLEGKRLWYGAFDGRAKLESRPLDGGTATQIRMPPLKDDAIAYIAQNPASRLEYAIATFGRSVYLTKDSGKTWTQIAERGQSK